MCFPDTLRSHEKQPEQLSHWIFFNEFFAKNFGPFESTIRRTRSKKPFKVAASVPLRDDRVVKQSIDSIYLEAITTNNTVHAVARNARPACASACGTS